MLLHAIIVYYVFFFSFRAEFIKSKKAGRSDAMNSFPQQLDIKKLRIASVKNQNNKSKKGGLTKQEIEVLRLLLLII